MIKVYSKLFAEYVYFHLFYYKITKLKFHKVYTYNVSLLFKCLTFFK